jgi:hypothetical protein
MALITIYTATNTGEPTSISGERKLGDFTPSSLQWSLQDVSAGDAGRTQSGLMYKQRITQKRKLALSWQGVSQTLAASILTAFNNEYIKVVYPDAMAGANQTRTFYVGDRSAPVYMYTANKKLYQNISFDIIER